MKTILHNDHTLQQWVERASSIPDREYAAMEQSERDRVIAHLDSAAFVSY